ncbi:MAG: hydroxymethylbilane synthase [Deltaproteobacteria bacterium]
MRAAARRVVVGARGSALSVAQTMQVIRSLRRKFPRFAFELRKITTLGDRVKDWSRDAKGIFVKELEDGLRDRTIDLAVHSMKDMPSALPKGLVLGAACKASDPRDAIISRDAKDLSSLKRGALVGTTSLRRQAQVLRLRPDLKIAGLRGNLDTRVRKLEEGLYDAIIVAAAGLKRLSMRGTGARPIPEDVLLPACGQGVLGLEIREGDKEMARFCAALNDPRAFARVEAEREFLRATGGGCRLPVAVHALIRGKEISLKALIISTDGKRSVSVQGASCVADGKRLARRLAREALKNGGSKILKEIR